MLISNDVAFNMLHYAQLAIFRRSRPASNVWLAVVVQAYLALAPLLDQTSLLSEWSGKLLGVICEEPTLEAT